MDRLERIIHVPFCTPALDRDFVVVRADVKELATAVPRLEKHPSLCCT
jgi:hypothetical protein